MNEAKFQECLEKYIDHCSVSKWVKDECYKFYFGNWLSRKVNLKFQSNDKVLGLCKEALKIDYSLGNEVSRTGVQFLQKGGREKLSVPISFNDVAIIKFLSENNLPEEDFFSKRGTSYTTLSGWLSTLIPSKFMPLVTDDFYESICFLFDVSQFPKKGYQYFVLGQQHFITTKRYLKESNIEKFFLPHINSFLSENGYKEAKKTYQEVDWNWVVQDFHLFICFEFLKSSSFKNVTPKKSVEITPKETPVVEPLTLYIPRALELNSDVVLQNNREKVFTEEDYLAKYKNQLKKGNWGEKVVYQDEVFFLNTAGLPELANQVEIVSQNPDLGFDIKSFEVNGDEKRIEVKSITNSSPKSFFISKQELYKQSTFDNYYIYCVEEQEDKPVIYRLRKPDLTDKELFELEPVAYSVRFM